MSYGSASVFFLLQPKLGLSRRRGFCRGSKSALFPTRCPKRWACWVRTTAAQQGPRLAADRADGSVGDHMDQL